MVEASQKFNLVQFIAVDDDGNQQPLRSLKLVLPDLKTIISLRMEEDDGIFAQVRVLEGIGLHHFCCVSFS